ncbi:MerR family transcriptional regulator [Haematobacter missouriensis]|uniref:MerR family transcriptional regulator n=1 Tax=Haematobacter missouriensis TaxID=366616 RepID=A0A212AKF2_9RHOB|nr:MerR family transcriptional regulator [Haematobacter missouriensis]KFI24436.1 MerR family transcriptional regulator [Haematobacter missouriensis]OWJ73589.1 MerR family transcriptional regulator [Haematobacter missouriensis]OWJ81994.1 MerR family transcriptional regulator [Haematobacter missouriensis]
MKIGEIARAASVTTSRIRFYERRGIIAPAIRGENGYRDYPEELVAILRFIEQAQSLGFSLKEIAGVEITGGEHLIPCDEAIHLLSKKLSAVDAVIAEAKQRKSRIEVLIRELQQRSAQEGPSEPEGHPLG